MALAVAVIGGAVSDVGTSSVQFRIHLPCLASRVRLAAVVPLLVFRWIQFACIHTEREVMEGSLRPVGKAA